LSARMAAVREIVSLGRSARMTAKLKVRQPLAKVEVILADRRHQTWLEQHDALIAEELNVKAVEFATQADRYITYSVLPDLKRLGPRLGKRLPELRKALSEANAGLLLAELEKQGKTTLAVGGEAVELDSQDVQVRLQANPGWAAAQGACGVVVLSTELTTDLIQDGLAREVVHAVQTARKDLACEYTDRIQIGITTEDEELRAAIEKFGDYIRNETLAETLTFNELTGIDAIELKLAGHVAELYIKVADGGRKP